MRPVLPDEDVVAVAAGARPGLDEAEAVRRLRELGPNAIPEPRRRPLVAFLAKLWAPVPWMLEATLVLELVLGHRTQAAIVALLLVVNAVLSAVEEGRARDALELLRARLAFAARVRRDGRWRVVPAEQLVPGDLVYLRMGDLVPADVKLIDGQVLADHSALTGESLPVDVGPGASTYSGALVRRGEALAEVTATGARSFFGKTAELVRLARATGRFEALVLRIVRALVLVDAVLVLAVVGDALAASVSLVEVAPFALMVLVASVPVALPATFTLATAVGALELAKEGVLVTRLSAVEDAAAMDVLCTDKTGTITKNELRVAATHAHVGRAGDEVLRLAALASRDATQDPIDAAILAAARERGLLAETPERVRFVPFDPALKRSEGFYRDGERELRVVKGAPQVVAALDPSAEAGDAVERLSARGERVIAVASGSDGELRLAGFVALEDPPRDGTKRVIERLRELGIRVIMVTGDAPATARAVAADVGIGSRTVPREAIAASNECPFLAANAFAGVLPEDKIHLVEALQRDGHVVGMTGDGVNDAPALKQAEVGIAVANATDVAKGAASVVLTRPGLDDTLAAIETSRRVYQRMLTYTLNKVVKTFHVALLLGVGFLASGVFLTTPRLILLLLLANDFVTMSIASDRAVASRHPDEWNVRSLVASALALAAGWLVFSTSVVLLGRYAFGLELGAIQTLVFLALVLASQATVFLVRERRRFWSSRPGSWLVAGAVVAVGAATFLAVEGILMAPIPLECAASVFALALAAIFVLDGLKVALFERLGVTRRTIRCS